jgi:hypothetical protein
MCEASSGGILVNIQNGCRNLLFSDQLVFVLWGFLQFVSVQAQICAGVGETLTRMMNGIKLPHMVDNSNCGVLPSLKRG